MYTTLPPQTMNIRNALSLKLKSFLKSNRFLLVSSVYLGPIFELIVVVISQLLSMLTILFWYWAYTSRINLILNKVAYFSNLFANLFWPLGALLLGRVALTHGLALLLLDCLAINDVVVNLVRQR